MRRDRKAGSERLPRRGTDRVEDAAVWFLLAAGLLVVMLGTAVGLGVHTSGMERIRQEAADRTQLTATAVRDAAYVAGASGAVAPPALTDVSWTGTDGVLRSGQAVTPSMTRAGQQVTVWVDRSGAPVDEPEHETGVAVTALYTGLGVVLAGVIVLFAGWLGIRRGLAVLYARGWEREWATVGPQWTGHGGDRRHDVRGRPTD